MRTMQELMKADMNQAYALNQFAEICHEANRKWWLDLTSPCHTCHGKGSFNYQPDTGGMTLLHCTSCDGLGYPRRKDRNVGELIALCHSELSEALEGHRKSLPDDKLPHRRMFEVELADLLIRVFDLAAGMKLDIGGAFVEKQKYNRDRANHKIENRLKEGGKAY